MSASASSTLAFALAMIAAILAGCSSSDPVAPIVNPPGDTLATASTPAGALTRFTGAMRSRDRAVLSALLTADFRFAFSDVDGQISALYPGGWSKADEETFWSHLVLGFRNTNGESLGAVTSISLVADTTTIADPTHPDSSSHYRVGKFTMTEVLFRDFFSGDEEFKMHDLQGVWLVRGDAAVLGPGQSNSADRWYVRRWTDGPTTMPKTVTRVIHPSQDTRWGLFKHLYRR